MAKTSGFTVKSYKYYEPSTKSVDFEAMKHDLEVNI
jgi:aspartate/tyrosine/aromatic aminotransferase